MWHCKYCDKMIEDGGLVILPTFPYHEYDEIHVCPFCYCEDDLEYIDD